MTRPVLGSQAADNAAWEEIRAALRAEAPDSLHDEVVDDLASVVGSVLARLVDQAVPAGELVRPRRLSAGDVLDLDDGQLTVSRVVRPATGMVLVYVENVIQPLKFSPEDRVWVR